MVIIKGIIQVFKEGFRLVLEVFLNYMIIFQSENFIDFQFFNIIVFIFYIIVIYIIENNSK